MARGVARANGHRASGSRRLMVSAVLLALSVSLSAGQDPETSARSSRGSDAPRAAALRARGLELGYNLDHVEALDAFKQAIAADPDDPSGYILAAGTAWTASLFEQGAITVADYLGQARPNLHRQKPSAALDTAFHENLRHALALSEGRLRKDPDEADAHYQVGAAYGFLASYNVTVEGRVLGSLGPARRAYREHERVLDLEPHRKDAGLIVGLYRYAIAD